MHGVNVMQVFKECQTRDASDNSFELSMVGCKCIGAYVKNKKNQNQVTKIFFIRLFTYSVSFDLTNLQVVNFVISVMADLLDLAKSQLRE